MMMMKYENSDEQDYACYVVNEIRLTMEARKLADMWQCDERTNIALGKHLNLLTIALEGCQKEEPVNDQG